MKEYKITASDGREFRECGYSANDAIKKVNRATYGRVEIVKVQEVYYGGY